MADKPMLYALSTCIHCKHTKELLDEKGVDYDHIYVDKLDGDERKQTLDEVKNYNPNISFPTLVIDNEKVVVGYKKQEIEEALNN